MLYLLSLQPLLEPVEVLVAPSGLPRVAVASPGLSQNESRVSPVSEPPRFTPPETRSHPDKLRTPTRTGAEQLQNNTRTQPKPAQKTRQNKKQDQKTPKHTTPQHRGEGTRPTHTADGAHAETPLAFAEVISNTPHR